MTRNGVPIANYPLKHKAKSAGITYSIAFLEYEACTHANLDYWQWEQGVYPNHFKAKVVAGYNLHHAVEAHVQDANIKK